MHNFSARVLASSDLGGTCAGDSTRKFCPVQITNADDIAFAERALTTNNSWGKQASTRFAQRLACAVIHKEGAAWMMKKCNPAFAALEFLRLGHKKGPFFLARQHSRQIVLLPSGGDNHRDTGAHDNFGGLQLRTHSPHSR